MRIPTTLPMPDTARYGRLAFSCAGTPAATTKGVVTRRPTSIIQASDEGEPITLTVREDMRLELAKKQAVSKPNTTLTTPSPYRRVRRGLRIA